MGLFDGAKKLGKKLTRGVAKGVKEFVPVDIKNPMKRAGRAGSNLAERAGNISLTKTIQEDTTIDSQSKSEFLEMLLGGTKVANVAAEFRKAVEGIDPKYRSRKNVEEYYKAMIDKPGAKQTRSPDLLLSNAFNGVIGR